SHVLPSLATIAGPIHAFAGEYAVSRVSFPRADPDYIGIGWSDRDVPNGRDPDLIKDGNPRFASVCGFPHASAGGTDKHDGGLAFENGDRRHSAAHFGRPD